MNQSRHHPLCGNRFSFLLAGLLCLVVAEPARGWERAYGGSGYFEALAIELTADSGYVVAGAFTSFSPSWSDIIVSIAPWMASHSATEAP